MLTRSQIQRLAQRHGIGIQAQERDYVQHLLLFGLYSHSQELTFKGGTALRIVYKGNRYSEDLDFNGNLTVEKTKNTWQNVLRELIAYGLQAGIRNEWQSDFGYSFDVSYQGPIYDGRDRTKGKVRVDISLRRESVETKRELISPEYDDLRPFVATVLSPEHLMAEKVRALLVRNKARDMYDIWLLKNQGISINKELVEQKLKLYELTVTRSVLNAALLKAKGEWDRDLRPLLPQNILWDDVAGQLEKDWGVLF
ncbi:MAG: nucleotidyl transferase AbiEii/AbiGii toxin family protein [Chloroflexi bacterium]|nr:MAG: nucleotidyl transferase AbiEii/AbiGii toxin family protein [Chloroflexota bacterium]